MSESDGVNVFGFLSASLGLGVAGRQTASLVAQSGLGCACVDLELPGVERVSFECSRMCDLAHLPFYVNVYHLNPPEYYGQLLRWRRRVHFDVRQSLNSMVPFWELPGLPTLWSDVLATMDVVLAPSRFICDVVREAMPVQDRPLLIHYPQVVAPPESVRPNRAKWLGSREHSFVVLFVFDAGSEIERKNPAAAIRAFQQAFGDRPDVALVLKVSRVQEAAGQQWRAVESAARDSRVIVVDEHLPRRDLWELYASTDAFLSLHRAEGLGLSIMEAMALGKPVVVTGWSGNMDFTNETNSLLVPYAFRRVSNVANANYLPLSHLMWAEPDADAAAGLLRKLADSREMRMRLGHEGAETVRRLRSSNRGSIFQDLSHEAQATIGSKAHARRCARARRISRAAYPEYNYGPLGAESTRFAAVRLLRKAHLMEPGPEPKPPSFLT